MIARISDMGKIIGSRESVMSLKWYTSKINKSRPIIVRSLKTKYRNKAHRIIWPPKMLSNK